MDNTPHRASTRMPKLAKVSFAEKNKNNQEWAKQWIDYIDGRFATSSHNWYDIHKRMDTNYRLFNNELDQEDLRKECDPFNLTVDKVEDIIQPYNKSYNKINTLLGEEAKRPFRFTVTLLGDEGINSRLAEKSKKLQDLVNAKFQEFIGGLQMQMMQERMAQVKTNPETQEEAQALEQQMQQIQQEIQQAVAKAMPPDEIESHLSTSYQDAREILASKILRYLVEEQRIREKKTDAFKHALISGIEPVFIGNIGDKPIVKVLNPMQFVYHKSPETKYFEDGMYAGYRELLDYATVLDRFPDLTADELESLVHYNNGETQKGLDQLSPQMDYNRFDSKEYRDLFRDRTSNHWFQYHQDHGNYGEISRDLIPVFHCQWRSYRKIGKLQQVDLTTGELEELFVSEDYKLNPELGDLKIEWLWIPEIYEGTRIGWSIYKNIGPVKHSQFNPMYPEGLKLDYHGAAYSDTNAGSISMLERMKPFQYLYFIIVHKMKKLIAKDRGTSMSLDVSMLDPKLGLERTLYYLEEMDINFYNPYANGDNELASRIQRPALQGGVNRSTMQNISGYIQLLAALDEQIGEVAGVTRQREGSISASENVGNVQQAVVQSNNITEMYFVLHSNIWRNALQHLIQVAKYVYRDNPLKIVHRLDDMSAEILNSADADIHDLCFGIMLTDSTKEAMKFEKLQALSHALIQNDKAKLSDIVTMLHADSISEIEKRIVINEKAAEQAQQAQAEREQQMQQAQLEAQQKLQDQKFAHEEKLLKMKLEAEIQKAEITSFIGQMNQDQNANGVPDQLELEKLRIEKEKIRQGDVNGANQTALAREKMNQDAQLKREEMASKERIEAEKAKNKTTEK